MKLTHHLLPSILSTMTIFSVVVRGFSPMPSNLNARRAIIHNPLCTILQKSNNYKVLFSTTSTSDEQQKEKQPPPMTLLSGFLGSGKTTTLQNLLSNKDGIKIGVVVNDVASVNIDSKLLSNPNNVIGSEETVELQNGCACCSLADELLTSVQQLTDNGNRELDHIVIELSGVADPMAVKNNWVGAEMMKHPATKLARFDKIVTLVDSSTFGTDWMTWDSSGDREGWVDPNDECAGEKKVPELLSEQIEAADVLIVNKIDIAGEEQVRVASNLLKVLNDKATVFETKFGGVSVRDIIGAPSVVTIGDKDCNDADCTDSSHSHHDHSHSHDHGASCSDTTCDDPAHDHSQSHHHDVSCNDPVCNDPTHDHSHSHDHDASCSDPTCNDPTHDHSHSHNHHSTSTDSLGISNFVYKRDRPFNAIRLLGVLHTWPVPVKDELDLELLKEAADDGFTIDGKAEKSPFVGVLRSKGFCWMAPTKWTGPAQDVWRHNTAMYWSHAGKHFGVSTAGKWWGTISKEMMKIYFENNEKEYERILSQDFVSEEFGDRRQEIVFIGANINEDEITAALDECLCTDEEMELYRREVSNFEMSTLTTTVEAVSPVSDDGPSLFNVGGTDNVDVNIRRD